MLQTQIPPAIVMQTRAADQSAAGAGLRLSAVVVMGVFRVLEFVLMAGLGLVIAMVYINAAPLDLAGYAAAAVATALLAGSVFSGMGLYELSAGQLPVARLPRVVAGWTLMIAALTAAVFFLKLGDAFSRVWLASWYVGGLIVLVLARIVVGAMLKRWSKTGQLVRRAVVYGHGPASMELIEALGAQAKSGIRVCGIFDDRGTERDSAGRTADACRGGLGDLVSFVRSNNIDLVLVALPISAESRLMTIVQQLWVLPADIQLVGSASRLRLSRRAYSYIGGVASIPLADKPIADWGVVAKWLFDKLIGMAALVVLSPLMLATAIAIKLDSKGPVLFRQKRYGFNNELIEVFKFRSMYVDVADASAAKLVTKDDPRVTRVGRFIRKSSIDELPQLFNVLIGNLSLVGPRPHAVSAKAAGMLYDEAVDSYFARHKVKPGITGWAQVNGWRGETDTYEKLKNRIEHDLEYIENWSVLFDAWILISTPFALLKTDNAY